MRKLLVLVAGIAAGCGSLTEQPDMTFEMKNVLAESKAGCDSDATACARFEVNYPVLIDVDTMVQAAINERVVAILAAGQGSPGQTIERLAKDFVDDFDSFHRENPEFNLGWYFDGNVSVLIATDTLISLQVDSESFTGGAHGSFTTRFVNVDPATGTDYLLGALLRPGYEDALERLAEEDFERQRMPPADSVQTGLESSFKLNDNYGFRKEGIVFYFNDYELGSYAEGPTEILIPYERLGAWMKNQ
jgi:hypothetical protein